MSIRKYEIFLKTVDLGSLTKASQILGYTQSALSHMIAGLEDEWGLKLLIRNRTGVSLTDDGRRLLPAIRKVCQENQALFQQVSEIHDLQTGSLRIGTILSVSTHLLPDLIYTFLEKHPDIDFELLQGNYDDITQWISENRIDCGFLRLPTDESFDTILMVREKFMAIFPADRVVDDLVFRFEHVKEEPYILRPDTLDGELSKFLKNASYQPKITYSAKDDFAVMAMVEKGLGMSILPELLMKDTAYRLKKVELDPPIYREICLAYKNTQSLSPVARAWIRHVKEETNKRLAPPDV